METEEASQEAISEQTTFQRVLRAKRPPRLKELTPEFVYACAKRFISQEVIGALFGVSQSAVSQRLKNEPALRDAWIAGKAAAAMNLHAAQYISAVEKGNVVAQIWLGKNALGQRDAVKELEVHNDTQVTFTAVWGGRHADEVGPGDEVELIEGTAEEE
jgi:predicted transcriptional regulator